jgi:hypothetical protein
MEYVRLQRILATLSTLLLLGACAATERQAECKGPWVPVAAAGMASHG